MPGASARSGVRSHDLRRRSPRSGRFRGAGGTSRPRASPTWWAASRRSSTCATARRRRRLLRRPSGPTSSCWPPPRSAASWPTAPTRPTSSPTTCGSRSTCWTPRREHGVERLLFLGSSCIYPKLAAAADPRGLPAHRAARADQRRLRDRQDRRHPAGAGAAAAVRPALHLGDADEPLRPGRQLRPRELATCCPR